MDNTTQDWIEQLKARGMGGTLRLLLDVIEPLGPLGAQLLYVAQPMSALFGWREALGAVASALEEPSAVEEIRRRLDEAPTDGEGV